MKTYTITQSTKPLGVMCNGGNTILIAEGLDEMQVSDGYHTMDELYDHRHLLYIALCKVGADASKAWEGIDFPVVWRSKQHKDGTMFEGMFILGIGEEPGKQITYHLPLSLWDQTSFAKNFETAPEWDGHTPEDVLNRLVTL